MQRARGVQFILVMAVLVAVSAAWWGGGRACAQAGEASAAKLVELLAGEAVGAIRLAAWHEGELLSPVLSMSMELDEAAVVAALVEPVVARGSAVWSSMRLGRKTPEGPRVAAAIDAADGDLDCACALLVREALVGKLAGVRPLPPGVIAAIAEALSAPPANPAADPALVRAVERFERSGKLGRQLATQAMAMSDEILRVGARAQEWRVRFDAVADSIARAADGAEGRAIVAVIRAQRLAMSGWAREEPRLAGGGAGGGASTAVERKRPDQVRAAVQLAMLERGPCISLAEVLLDARARRVDRVESLFVSPEGTVVVGRGRSELTQESIDAWRTACGMKRTSRGWEGLRERPRARPLRLRNAPFGISPPERGWLGYAPSHEFLRHPLPAADAVAAVWNGWPEAPLVGTRAGGRMRCARNGRLRAARARGDWDHRRGRSGSGRALESAAADALHRAGCPPRRAQG